MPSRSVAADRLGRGDRDHRQPLLQPAATSHGDYASAFQHGIIGIAAFAVAALALVLADALTRNASAHP
jgi:hypothetical protein